MRNGPTIFFAIVEGGELERKTCLLVKSLRDFGGAFRHSEFWVINPRKAKPVKESTRQILAGYGVRFLASDLNSHWAQYPLANKIYVAAFMESLFAKKAASLVFCDSDMVFLGPPEGLVLRGTSVCALRPVDIARSGAQTLPAPDSKHIAPIWREALAISGVKWPIRWSVRSTCDRVQILPYFNSGLISVRPECGIYGAWRANLEKFKFHRSAYSRYLRRPAAYHFLEQILFSTTLLSRVSASQIRILPPTYNYPVLYHEFLSDDQRVRRLDEVVVCHYHHLRGGQVGNLARLPQSDRLRRWLQQSKNLRLKEASA